MSKTEQSATHTDSFHNNKLEKHICKFCDSKVCWNSVSSMRHSNKSSYTWSSYSHYYWFYK